MSHWATLDPLEALGMLERQALRALRGRLVHQVLLGRGFLFLVAVMAGEAEVAVLEVIALQVRVAVPVALEPVALVDP